MKKIFPYLILFVIVGVIIGSIFYIFEEQLPFDDTKRLYANCGLKHEKVPAIVESDVVLFEGKGECEMKISIRDVQRESIKLKSEKYIYYTDADGNIDERSSNYDIVVSADETLIVYGPDKTTKFTFQFK